MSTLSLANGTYSHLIVSKNTIAPITEMSDTWNKDIILNCNFNGNIEGGNINYSLGQAITQIKIKRRVKGTFDWMTICVVDIQNLTDLDFSFDDTTTLQDVTYEYICVPVFNGVEGSYTMAEATSTFKGVFICDTTAIFRVFGSASYGVGQQNQQVGVLIPYGRKYPVIVANGIVGYQTGSVSGKVLPNHYYKDGIIDRKEIVQMRIDVQNFLTNKKPKIIKDSNGNSWLVVFVGNPSVEYDANYGMGVVTIGAEWTEVGDPQNKEDLFKANLIPNNS